MIEPIPPLHKPSGYTEKGAEITLNALELGAVDVVTKPKMDLRPGLRHYREEPIAKVKVAAHANVRPHTNPSPHQLRSNSSAMGGYHTQRI